MTFAMVFPGQGSQSLGMQKALADEYPVVAETYAEASDVLGFDLWKLVQTGPQEELDQTVITQPAMLTAGIAAWRCWLAAGGQEPASMTGHSLGEYTALVASDALPFAEAVSIVRQRAELMQAAVPAGEGAMAAVLGLDDDTVINVCEAAANGEVVSAVNFNSPGQVVIAGERAAVERAVDGAKEAGAKRAIMLRVSVPSHSALMKPAADELAGRLAATEFSPLRIPVINVVDVEHYDTPDSIRDGLRRQLFCPVLWSATIQRLASEGATTIIECGPGKVLAGLVRRIDRSLTGMALEDVDSLNKALDQVRAL